MGENSRDDHWWWPQKKKRNQLINLLSMYWTNNKLKNLAEKQKEKEKFLSNLTTHDEYTHFPFS